MMRPSLPASIRLSLLSFGSSGHSSAYREPDRRGRLTACGRTQSCPRHIVLWIHGVKNLDRCGRLRWKRGGWIVIFEGDTFLKAGFLDIYEEVLQPGMVIV